MHIDDEEYELFRSLIHEATGIVLSDRRRQLICTRLSGRLRHYGYRTFREYYVHLVRRDPDGAELRSMLNAMTTNKTSFFREEHHFAMLREALPAWTRGPGAEPLRLWSAGCSTGEEPYSIAITLLEEAGGASWLRRARILATDVDTDVLATAERGIYPSDRAERVPPDLLRRYFLRGTGRHQGQVRAAPCLRELVRFRHLNFQAAAWPMRGLFHAIFCRNVMIYFDPPTQERLVCRLAQHLHPGGCLFLGHSESMLGLKLGLDYLGRTTYQKPLPGEGAGATT